MPKRKTKKKSTSKTKIDKSSNAKQSSQIPKRKKTTSETKNVKIDESSSSASTSQIETKKMEIDKSSSSASTSQIETKKMKIDKNQLKNTKIDDQDTSIGVMNISAQDFRDIRYMEAFVDKTLLIKEVLINPAYPYILVTAPRRFGKSCNLTMLRRFFAKLPDEEEQRANRKLFENTLIEKELDFMSKHCGKYPVLYLDFRSAGSVCSYDSAFEFIRKAVQEVFKSHEYLKSSDKLEDEEKEIVKSWCSDRIFETLAKTNAKIYEAIQQLASYVVKHHGQKIFLFVDEYDGVCSDAVIYCKDKRNQTTDEIISNAENELKEIIALYVGALSCLLKPKSVYNFVQRAVLTGISYIMTMGLSKLPTVEVFHFQEDHEFVEFYGLTWTECRELLSRPTIQLVSEYDKLLGYYNGYKYEILSIWSIMKYLIDKLKEKGSKMKNYWIDVGIIYDLYSALRITAVGSILTKLLSKMNNVHEIDIIRKITYRDISKLKNMLSSPHSELQNVDIFFSFLLEQGYFSVVEINEVNQKMKIKIPNSEIKLEFSQEFLKFYVDTYNLDITLIKTCASLFDEICSIDDEKNEEILKEVCLLMNEIIKPAEINSKNEATLHHIIFIIIFHCLKFKCYSEIRANRKNLKRLDLLMLFEKFGIILELKNEKNPEVGLLQIIENKYYDAFVNPNYNHVDNHIEYFILIGLSMSEDYKISMSILLNDLDYNNRKLIN